MAECGVREEGVRNTHAVVLGGDQTARAACCSYFGTALGYTTGTASACVAVLLPRTLVPPASPVSSYSQAVRSSI